MENDRSNEHRLTKLEVKVETLEEQYCKIDAKLDRLLKRGKGGRWMSGIIIGMATLQLATIAIVVAIVYGR